MRAPAAPGRAAGPAAGVLPKLGDDREQDYGTRAAFEATLEKYVWIAGESVKRCNFRVGRYDPEENQ